MASWLINFQKMYWELDQAGNTMVDELLTFMMEEFKKYEHDLHKRQVMNPNFQVISPPSAAGRTPSDLGGPEMHLCSGTWSCRILRASEVRYRNPLIQDFNKGIR